MAGMYEACSRHLACLVLYTGLWQGCGKPKLVMYKPMTALKGLLQAYLSLHRSAKS